MLRPTARWLIVSLAGLLALSAAIPASAQDLTATVELRVWQRIQDPLGIYVSARHQAGSWATLGTIPLSLDRENSRGTFRYGDISLEVPLASGNLTTTVELRVWQRIQDPLGIYVSARHEAGSWATLGTIPLSLDRENSRGTFRYGDVSLEVPLPGPRLVAGPPATLGLAPFYEKYLDAGGLPVVASSDVPDAALFRARDIIDEMLAHSNHLRATMAEQGLRVAIMATSSVLTSLPEFSDLTEFSPGVSWDERTRGGGVGPTSQRPVVVIATENLLCYGNDVFPYEDIFVHEFAHGVLNMGVEQQGSGKDFRKRLNLAYSKALEAGLWKGTYAGVNSDEYWAEGVQSWFDLNDPPGYIHNAINTRAELEAYDSVLAGLIREVFGDVTISTSCHEVIDIQFDYRIQGVVVGPAGEPLQGVGLWAWQGERYNSGNGETGTDGTFAIGVPEGSFTLDVYSSFVGPDCEFVGWYDGAGGLATTYSLAAKLVVEDASVEGIKITLPGAPEDLPRLCHK